MVESEKSHQISSDDNQIIFKNVFEVNKSRFFLVKKLEIQIIVSMIMLSRSFERREIISAILVLFIKNICNE